MKESQYADPALWTLDRSQLPVKIYQSVPTAVPARWRRERGMLGVVRHASGDYVIVGRPYGGGRRKTYVVRRKGVELPLSFTGNLADAKAYALKNALGMHRINVA